MDTLPDSFVAINETPAEYSVCLQTGSKRIYVAEFRTLQEATQIAEHACQRGDATVKVRHDGHDVRVLSRSDGAA